MANYTMEIRDLVNLGYHFALESYPIFDENYRSQLNEKIIAHYWYREIGQETPDRFNHYLRTRMNEIMPYYNKLYMSELIKFDPIATDYLEGNTAETRVHEAIENFFGNTDGNTTNIDTTTETSDNKNIGTLRNKLTGSEVGSYNKQGNRTVETVGNRKESLNEDITSHSTTTNDLKTTTDVESDGNGTNDTTGTKTTNFSDIPQAGVTTSITTKPDGTITTESTGYLTTQTVENTREHAETTTHETSHSEGTNTGTVDVDGTSNRKNDNNIDTTETQKEIWEEVGGDTRDTTSDQDQSTSDYTLIKNDSVTNSNRNYGEVQNRMTKNDENTGTKSKEFRKGRSGFSPSALLNEYRQTLLNIDMLIINDLGDLFMEVY